jgi:hypothetical protein
MLMQDLDRQNVWPPILVGATKERANGTSAAAIPAHRAPGIFVSHVLTPLYDCATVVGTIDLSNGLKRFLLSL